MRKWCSLLPHHWGHVTITKNSYTVLIHSVTHNLQFSKWKGKHLEQIRLQGLTNLASYKIAFCHLTCNFINFFPAPVFNILNIESEMHPMAYFHHLKAEANEARLRMYFYFLNSLTGSCRQGACILLRSFSHALIHHHLTPKFRILFLICCKALTLHSLWGIGSQRNPYKNIVFLT